MKKIVFVDPRSPEEKVIDSFYDVGFYLSYQVDEPLNLLLDADTFSLWLAARQEQLDFIFDQAHTLDLINDFTAECQEYGIRLSEIEKMELYAHYLHCTHPHPNASQLNPIPI